MSVVVSVCHFLAIHHLHLFFPCCVKVSNNIKRGGGKHVWGPHKWYLFSTGSYSSSSKHTGNSRRGRRSEVCVKSVMEGNQAKWKARYTWCWLFQGPSGRWRRDSRSLFSKMRCVIMRMMSYRGCCWRVRMLGCNHVLLMWEHLVEEMKSIFKSAWMDLCNFRDMLKSWKCCDCANLTSEPGNGNKMNAVITKEPN